MTTVLEGIEFAMNRFIALDTQAQTRLEALSGSRVALTIEGPALAVEAELGPNGVRLGPLSERSKDVRISGSPLALLRMVHEARTSGDVSGADVKISGDVELVQQLKQFMVNLDIDWEEQLSKVVGDAGARGFSVLARSFAGWVGELGETFALNAHEYLNEEVGAVASSDELRGFAESVDEVRDDVERLSAKISRLRGASRESIAC